MTDIRPSATDYEQAGTAITRQGFGSNEIERRNETQAIAAAETAKAVVQARYIVALQRPRDVDEFRVRVLRHCKRPRFAEVAEYAKPVGGQKIKGPSIRFVESALQEYENVQVDAAPVYDDDDKRIMRVTVVDLERNVCHATDVTVEKFVERRKTKPGDEVIGQRVNSYGDAVFRIRATEDDYANKVGAAVSKAVRNLGLRVLPSDIVAECMDACAETRKRTDAQDPDAARNKLIDAFAGINVMPADLATYLGHEIGQSSPAEIDDLRKVFTAIRDGEASWHQLVEKRAEPKETKDDALKAKLAKK